MDAKDRVISEYFSRMGMKGGKKSRRELSSEDARKMVKVREARRLFRDYYAQCFWYMSPDLEVGYSDVPEIVRGLKKNGGRRGFLLAAKLCR